MFTTTLDLRAASFGQLSLSPGAKLYDPYFDARYILISEAVRQLTSKRKNSKILELGGQVSSLRHFLPESDITIADIAPPEEEVEKFILLTGHKLPFPSGSFDVVVSCDTLEHVPSSERDEFITEMLRVSSKYAVIGGPFESSSNHFAEHLLRSFYQGLVGQNHRWLDEHQSFGLPTHDWLDALIDQNKMHYTRFEHSDPILWSILLTAYVLSSASSSEEVYEHLVDEYLQRMFTQDFTPGGYRTFYLIARNGRIKVDLPNPHPTAIKIYAAEVASAIGSMIKKLTTRETES